MQKLIESPAVEAKLRELSEAILADPTYRHHMSKVEKFLENEEARDGYRQASELGHSLQMKRHQGQEIDPEEMAEFDRQRETLVANPLVRDFLDAQHTLGDLPATAGTWVQKTIELGRIPEPEDFQSSCCGGHGHDHDHEHEHCGDHGGCGCSH
jgi:cell fate (sporulation/competence/biofilm development) regulator YlbF (YheA/YmcA/DUF963 family)